MEDPIITNQLRCGRFTSSEIYRLMSNGPGKGNTKPGEAFYSYIDEKRYERKLSRSINSEANARALNWGKMCEPYAFDHIGTEYILCSKQTIVSEDPEFADYLCGTPDVVTQSAVGDIKCPLTLKAACEMLDAAYEIKPEGDSFTVSEIHPAMSIEAAMYNHDSAKKYFWQLVNNSILTGKKKAQLIVFVPYQRQLDEIRALAAENPKYRNFAFADDTELPYIHEGGHYINVSVIEFDILPVHVEMLLNRVRMAIKLLNR